MRTISYKLDDLKKIVIPIGFEGENDHTRVIIDAGEVFAQYPSAAASLRVKPPQGSIYPVVVNRDGDRVIWNVKDTDCASDGNGEAQFTFTENNVIVKSVVTKIKINRSLKATGPAPDPIEDWLDEANEALEEIQAAEVNQPTIGEDGYWYTWDQETGEYEKTETKAQGADGHSPVLTSSKSGKTTTLYADGEQIAQILDGEDGQGAYVIDDTAGEGDTDKTWSADKLTDEFGDVLNKIEGISEELIFVDNAPANLYLPQSIENIMDGYILKRGVPQTQYGSAYYVSDYVPVTGGKTIKFNYAVWGPADAAWRAAEYDSSKNYIDYISSDEHTLSANAAFIRFSARKDDQTAATTLAYVNSNLKITDGESGGQYLDDTANTFMMGSTVRKSDAYFVDASGDEILIMWKMPGANDKDIGIKMKTFNRNGAFSFSSFGTAPNNTEYVGNKPSNYVEYMATGEDHFSPFGVRAVNNADGDYPDTVIYTGGFHKKDSVDTARRISLDMYFDGRKISDFVGYCNTIDIVTVHRIQAENTFKTTGNGREVLEQTLRLHFENGEIKVQTDVKALESVVLRTWFFIQGHHKANGLGDDGIRYIGSNEQRGILSMDLASNSGDKYAKTMRMLSDVLQVEMNMEDFDVGRGDYNEQSFSCDVRIYDGYSKCYFNPVKASTNPIELDEGDMISARGSYRFGIFE